MGSNGALGRIAGSYKESSPEKYDLRRLPSAQFRSKSEISSISIKKYNNMLHLFSEKVIFESVRSVFRALTTRAVTPGPVTAFPEPQICDFENT